MSSRAGHIWILTLFLLAACLPAQTATPPPATLTKPSTLVTDKWSLWVTGTQLRGANIYQRRVFPALDGTTFLGPGPFGPPYTQKDFDDLAAAGANYVNLSVPGLFTVTPPYEPDPAAVANLDALLAMAARANLYVVISARTGPGRSEFSILREGAGEWFAPSYLIESVWEDTSARQAWAAMWKYTARRYRNNPIVIGYDLMVEPNANDILEIWDPAQFYAQYRNTGYDWNTWYPDLITAIRTEDKETPILVGGLGYSSAEWLPWLQPTDDPYTVYTVHQYQPFTYTHQEVGGNNTYPGIFAPDQTSQPERIDRQWLADILAPLDDFRIRTQRPVAVNECGVIRWQPGAANFMRDQLTLFEEKGFNYAIWMWYASWPPLAEGDNEFNFRLGPQPENLADTPNPLFALYQAFWMRNTRRPDAQDR